MSSAGGGSGIGGGAPQGFVHVEGPNVQLDGGAQVNLATAEGVAQAEAVLNTDQIAELDGVMRQVGFKRAGKSFAATDSYEMRRELGVVGPSATEGGTSLDAELYENVFKPNGMPNPYNANTTEQLYGQVQNSEAFKATVGGMNEVLANPTAANQGEFLSRMQALSAQYPHGNVMEVLFLVFRESIQETNEDKKYFLIKLQEFNQMAEQVSKYLSELVERSQALSEKAEGKKYPEKEHISVQVKTYDLSSLDKNGHLITLTTASKSLDRPGLNDTIKDVESMQETIRNKRQMASTAFQNFDQKANQLYNLMASVLKSLNEMRGGTVRNML